jgi:hypothetical protein
VGDYFHLLLYYYDQGTTGISSLRRHEESIRERMNIRLGRPPGNRS